MNEDYINGMKFLLMESKKQGINIRRCSWIPHVSKMLSEYNLCYKFWYNVVKQKYLHRVFCCKTWFDVMYEPDKWLFIWASTKEGINFWKTHLWGMLGLNENDNFFDYPEISQNMRL